MDHYKELSCKLAISTIDRLIKTMSELKRGSLEFCCINKLIQDYLVIIYENLNDCKEEDKDREVIELVDMFIKYTQLR